MTTKPMRAADRAHKLAILKGEIDQAHEQYWAGDIDSDELNATVDRLTDELRAIRDAE